MLKPYVTLCLCALLAVVLWFAAARSTALVVFLILAAAIAILVIKFAHHQKQVPPGHAVVREDYACLNPGTPYWKKPTDILIELKPDSALIQIPDESPMYLRWKPGPDIGCYARMFPKARPDFLEAVHDFLLVEPNSDVQELNARLAEQFGVTILELKYRPAPEPPKKRTRQERMNEAYQAIMDETGTDSKWYFLALKFVADNPKLWEGPDGEETKRRFLARFRNVANQYAENPRL